jgi:lysozyme
VSINLINVFAGGYYKSLPHQKEAIAYLQSNLTKKELEYFAGMWRNGATSQNALNLADVPKYYSKKPWQDQAIAYLEAIVKPEIRAKFESIWRSPSTIPGVNYKAIALIKNFEGCRLTAYNDGIGIPTIGWGHTEGVKLGDKITQAEADNLLMKDVQVFTDSVRELVRVPLTREQEAALISFAYNVGVDGFANSTLLIKLNRGDYESVSAEMARWINAGSPVEAGLRSRRATEGLAWGQKGSSTAIDWQNPYCRISKYFTVQEVTLLDDRRIPTDPVVIANILKLALELDKIREKWGKPIGVTSWYRPLAVNAEVGSRDDSQHINGSAADIYDIGGNEQEFESFLDKVWGDRALGYGVASGKGFTHLDLRNDGRRWNY